MWIPPDALVSAIRELATRRAIDRGEVIHGIGAGSDGIYLIMSGRIRMVRMSPAGRPLMLTLLYPGSWFGDINTLLDLPRTDDAIADTVGVLLHIPKARFLALLNARPDLQMLVLKAMAGRLRLALEELENSQLLTLSQRIARRLLALHAAQCASSEADLPLPLTQQMVADMVGVSRENAARILGGWARKGYVSSRRGILTLSNLTALASIAT